VIDDEGVVVMYDMIHYNTIMCVSKLIASHFKLCYNDRLTAFDPGQPG